MGVSPRGTGGGRNEGQDHIPVHGPIYATAAESKMQKSIFDCEAVPEKSQEIACKFIRAITDEISAPFTGWRKILIRGDVDQYVKSKLENLAVTDVLAAMGYPEEQAQKITGYYSKIINNRIQPSEGRGGGASYAIGCGEGRDA